MLPTSGEITLQMVKDELKLTGDIWLDSPEVRELAEKLTGQIWLSDLYGKSNTKEVNILLSRRTDISPWGKYYVNYNVVSGKLIVKTTTSKKGIWFRTDYNNTKIVVPEGTDTRESNVPSGTGHWIEVASYQYENPARGEIWFQGIVIA